MHLHAPHVIAAIVAVWPSPCQWLAWRTRIPAILFLLASPASAMGPLLQRDRSSRRAWTSFARSLRARSRRR
jgi:hypothetical protein